MSDSAIIGRVAVHVAPDLKGFYQETKDKLTAVEKRLKDLKVTFDVDLNLSETSKKHVEDQVNRIDGKIDVKVGEAAAKEVQARMAYLSRSRFATIYPKVDELAATKATRALSALTGARSIKDILKDAGEFIGELDRALPKFAAISTAVLNLTSSLMAGTANILSFGGALGQIGGLSLALPGIVGGLAIGVTAFAVAMKDFNKYVPNFAIGLGRATTAGQAWKHLQDTMSSRFWKNAAQPMRELINTLFPQFSSGMNKVSGQLGIFTGRLAKSFKGSFNGPMRGMFDDLSKSITVMSTHTGSLSGILANLGAVGAGNLPRLAGWFGDISDSFNKWLGDKRATGELQGFVDTGVKQLKSLGVVLRETGSSLAGLARAAEKAGGTTLDGLAKTMTHVADVINGKAFQTGFTKAFRGADDAMRNIADKSGAQFESFILRITNVLGRGLPIAGDAAGKALGAIFGALDTKNVENSFLGLIQSLDTAVTKLAPTMPSLAKAMAGVTRAGSALIQSIAGSLAPIIDKLGPKVASLADDLTPLIKSLGEGAAVLTNIGSSVLSALPNSLLLAGVAFLGVAKITTSFTTQLGKARAALGLTGAGAKVAAPSLRQLGNAMRYAAVSTTTLNKNLEGYGFRSTRVADKALKSRAAVLNYGKSIGGVAGQIGLLAVASTGVADKFGLTNTATLALAGSFAGPWGAAAGAAVGVFLDLKNSAGSSADALKLYDDALAGNTAALRDNAIKALEARKAQLEGLNWIQDGIHTLTGGAADLTKVNFALGELKRQATAPSTTTSLMTMLVEPTGQVTQAMRAAAAAAKLFDDNMKAMNGTLSRREAWRSYKEAIASVTQAAKTNGKTLDNNTSKGRANNAILDQMASGAAHVADTLKNSNKQHFLVQARQDFVTNARLLSDNEKRIQHLATKIFGFGKVKATAKVGVEEVKSKGGKDPLPTLDEIFAKGKKVDGKKFSATVDLKVGPAAKLLDQLIPRLNSLNKKVIRPTISFRNGADKAVQTLGINLKKLSNMKVKPTVTVQNKTKPQLSTIQKDAKKTGAVITSSANAATKKLGVMPGQFSKVGGFAMSGLAGGIRGGRSGVVNAAAEVVGAAIAAARAKAQIQSPSKVFKGIGKYITQGLVKGIAGGQSGVYSIMSKIIGKLAKNKGLQAYAKRVEKNLIGLAKSWEKYQQKVQAVATYEAGIKSTIQQIGSPVEINGGSFLDIKENLQNSLKDAQQFASVLVKLRDLKLNKVTVDQLAQAGPEAALAAAQAIADSGKAGVDAINDLQTQLNTAASKAAGAAGDVVFNTGKNVAKGLLAGLKAGQKDIEAMMTKIAQGMIKTIRKHLKIKSPSRVFKDLGHNTAKGFVLGIEGQVAASEKAIKKLGAGRPNGVAGRTSAVALAGSSAVTKNLYYYAAPGSSLDSEEDLFSAFNRARSVF